VFYTTAEGLSSNNVLCVTEDNWGFIYAGTGRALDRLDPSTGRVKHFTSADGLPNGLIEEAIRDHTGALWFGSVVGLARLTPEPQRERDPPSILITGLRVEGVARRISAVGETYIKQLDLGSSETQVSVDFVGLGASLGEDLKYEYRLEGYDTQWTQTSTRSVNFAHLAPGTYQLLIRATNQDGVYSAPAKLSFRIAEPVWRRWWFIALCMLAAFGVGFILYRYRVARLLQVANMRTRIATDLHDDIGSGLSRVAVLSEVVKRQTGVTAPQVEPLLDEIADSARTLVSSMRDIVWAIDPSRDYIGSLMARTRQFASDVLESKGIKLEFPATPDLENIRLDPEHRRHVYLILKEAVNNIARHAACSTASLSILVENQTLIAEVSDDGRGFNVEDPRPYSNGEGGHGMENMQRRVELLQGQLNVESKPGHGTRLRIVVPLK
jgi:signal transduction histidine kinase